MSTLMKSAMLRLPMLVMQPTVPCRQMSLMWFGPTPTWLCWNVGGVTHVMAGAQLPLVVTAMNACHCFAVSAALGCSRWFDASSWLVPNQMKPSLPGSPAAIQPIELVGLVAVCPPASTWIGCDQIVWLWLSIAESSEYT